MADLIAQGPETQQRWRRALPTEQSIVLGRASGQWAVPWDQHISRRHAELYWNGSRLQVVQIEPVRNPIYYHGQHAGRFLVRPGEHFVIGQTTFTLVDQRVNITADVPQPVQQEAFSPQYLKQIRFRNPDYRIEVLSRLPDVISGAANSHELCVRLTSMLLSGLPRADAAAVVAVEPPDDPGNCQIRVFHWDQRLMVADDFQPSRRLIQEALRLRQSVLHVWQGESGPQQFTARGHFDWAFCTPVLGEACSGWCLYLAGRFNVELPGAANSSDADDLREDVKFTELVASALSSLRQMQLLNRRHASFSQFFSPVVLSTINFEDPEAALSPRETEVSVLFCDLRGFSLQSERHSGNLIELLHRVSKALGVMTGHILGQGGVVGDFQGDAAMGFWGWPLAQPDAPLRVCRAALGIRAEFDAAAQNPESPLAQFRAGIGVATGRAVAGKIGTVDHVKVTVFGPVVNLASRLEGMTKVLHGTILIDAATAAAVRRTVPADAARVRRLAVVRPYGMETPIEVSELLPPAGDDSLLTDAHLAIHEQAVEHFLAGRWSAAYELLHQMPAADRAADFLTVYIAQNNRVPPAGWDGVIRLSSK